MNDVDWKLDYICYGSAMNHDFKNDEGFYIITPEHRMINSNPLICAYTNIKNNVYYVKVGEYGRLFNPYGYQSGTEKTERMGRNIWTFKKVKKDVFNTYVIFLKSKNEMLIRQAERMLE